MKVYKANDVRHLMKAQGMTLKRVVGSHEVWKGGTKTVSLPRTGLDNRTANRIVKFILQR